MHYDDWKNYFSTLFLNNDFPEDWTGVRFQSKWTKESGGLPAKFDKDLLAEYCNNPQFVVEPMKEDCQIVFSMTQTGGRLPVGGKYFDYPFIETL